MIFIMKSPFEPETKKCEKRKALHPAAIHGMKRLKISRSTVPPELCGTPHHSLCCNGRTRQRFTSALCGGRSPAHGRLLAARPSGRQPSLRHGETGPRFVRIIVLGHLILTHRRQKRRMLCASQDETTSNCSTERRKNQGLIAGK